MAEILDIILAPISLPDKHPVIKLETSYWNETITLNEKTSFGFRINPGQNLFSIEFLNKEPKDTKIVDGKIVNDLAVIIEKISYKKFDFKPHIDQLGIYVTNKDKIITETYGFMAFAGSFKFNIRGPLFILARDMAIINGY